jgi:hypothetical protein
MKVVKSHHQVLSLWAEYRRQRSRAPLLITLDHHTDTSMPFRNYLGKKFPNNKIQQDKERKNILEKISFLEPQSVKEAEGLLSHDEHILTALGCDILSGAFVVAQNARDTDLEVYQQHKVCCYSVARSGSVATISECHRVLESDFLNMAIEHFNGVRKQNSELELLSQDYILDVDLDYFNTLRGVKPEDAEVYLRLLKGAGLVTVATEPEHVTLCAREVDVTSEKLLESLEKLHATAY